MVTVLKQAKAAIAIVIIILIFAMTFTILTFKPVRAIIDCDDCAPGDASFLCMDDAATSSDWFCSKDCSNNVASECDGKKQASCIGTTGQICSAQCTKTSAPAENTQSTCKDGKDNDCDGKTDCDDPDCCSNDKTCKKDDNCNTKCGASEKCKFFTPNTNLANCEVGNPGIHDMCDATCQQVDIPNANCAKDNYCKADLECNNKAPGACSTSSGFICSTTNCKKVAAGNEICDGKDNDCDGSTDEGNVCNDIDNCGSFGNKCPTRANANIACSNGKCTFTCKSGYLDCNNNAADGCEASISTDINNCGKCGNKCSYANANALCQNSQCSMGSCTGNYADCNKNSADGCEKNLLNDPNNCGSCGRKCSLSHTTKHSCSGPLPPGHCHPAECESGWYNANGISADGCECQKTNNGVETCDGIDNDCNKKVDDNLANIPLCSKQKGVCKGASKTCGGEDGWKDCDASMYLAQNSSYEVSEITCDDGLDNDCDGDIDAGDSDCDAFCTPDTTRACGVGACIGNQTCQANKTWGPCDGPDPKDDEECNKIDDDCDGKVDEDFDADRDGFMDEDDEEECKDFYDEFDCDDTKSGVNPDATEVCSGNVDEDCDGVVNNGCENTQSIISETVGKTTQPTPIPTPVAPPEEPSRAPLYAGILAIVLIVVGVLVYWFYFKPKTELADLAVEHEVHEPEKATSTDVKGYIKESLSLGYSPDQIKSALLAKGWEEEKVDELLSGAYGGLTALGQKAEAPKPTPKKPAKK